MASDSVDGPVGEGDRGGGPEGQSHSKDLYQLEPLPPETTIFADASSVEVVGDTIQVTFVERVRRVTHAVWPAGHSQPSQVGVTTAVAEVARVRLTIGTANDLAMNILLELAQDFGFDLESFDRNVDVIWGTLREGLEAR